MNQERWRNLQELYEAASHSSGNRRLAILRNANLDPETENELRSMLDHSLEDDLFGDWASAGAAQLLINEPQLKVGHRLGPYTIEGTLGRGGMGQVYRALDSRLHRRVAIKLLHGAALMDSASRERFLAEANVIAGLNHPNICILHDIGSENGFDFLVMELVEGHTLRERLEKGPLPLGEVVEIGAALAAALGHAHGRGIIHRDVKPENVILGRSGPKLLDFGIALALVEVDPSQKPAGTPRYAAPEQSLGYSDARADIFSVSAVIYEMAAGRPAFPFGKVSSDQASDFSVPAKAGQEQVAARLMAVLSTGLAVDPAERWQSASDLARALRLLSGAQHSRSDQKPGSPKWIVPAAVGVLVLAFAVAIIAALWPDRRSDAISFALSPPPRGHFPPEPSLAISPDGKRVVFSAFNEAGERLLWLRRLGAEEPAPLPSTTGGMAPFWSPDGRSLGFFTGNKLIILNLETSAVRILAELTDPPGTAAWGTSGMILFNTARLNGGDLVYAVAAAGGSPRPVTSLNPVAQESRHTAPVFFNDGEHFIFTALSNRDTPGSSRPGKLYLARLGSAERTMILQASTPVAVRDDIVSYLRDGRIRRRKLDLRTGNWRGDELTVELGAPVQWFAGSTSGTLAYTAQPPVTGVPHWVDRSGRHLEDLTITPGENLGVVISRDGGKVAVSRRETDSTAVNLWVVESRQARRLTSGPGEKFFPLWSSDGQSLFFTYNGAQSFSDIRRIWLRSPEKQSVIYRPDQDMVVSSLHPDGRHLLVTGFDPKKSIGFELFLLDPESGVARRWNAGTQGKYSPDGRWIVYVCSSRAVWRICVSPAAEPSHVWYASPGTGRDPHWRNDGRELYFVDGLRSLVAVSVGAAGGEPVFGQPRRLFTLGGLTDRGACYAASPSGDRFLILSDSRPEPRPVVLIAPVVSRSQ